MLLRGEVEGEKLNVSDITTKMFISFLSFKKTKKIRKFCCLLLALQKNGSTSFMMPPLNVTLHVIFHSCHLLTFVCFFFFFEKYYR